MKQNKVLLLENIHIVAKELFENNNFVVEHLKHALSEEDLISKLDGVSILGIRSKTQITSRVLKQANKLKMIGAYCIGTNNIDLQTCLDKKINVQNAPFQSTRSVAELIIGEIIMLARRVFDKSNCLHQGSWLKSAKDSFEIRGKKLGIIGYGQIGTQLGVLAEALGMEVYYYDMVKKLTFGNAKAVNSLEDLLKLADIISIHVDGRKENHGLIGEKEFAQMKDGVLFLNASRGFIVEIEALAQAIKIGKVRGAAVDVFPQEPHANGDKFITPLQSLSNVILTPHIGAATLEAQEQIGQFVTEKAIEYMNLAKLSVIASID